MKAAESELEYPQPRCPSESVTDRLVKHLEATDGEMNRSLGALLRKQAARLIDWTLHAELELLLAQHASITDGTGHPAYVRNGYQRSRELVTNLGPVRIRVPKLRSRVERAVVFRSKLARPYLRRARAEINRAPLQFLRGLSGGDMHAAIGALMGPEAAALPAPVVRRVTERWEGEHKRWLTGSLAQLRRAALWLESLDGDNEPSRDIDSVMLAVAIDESAREQILAVVHGARATEQRWTQLLLGLRSRGMPPPIRMHASSKASRAIAAATATVYPEISFRS